MQLATPLVLVLLATPLADPELRFAPAAETELAKRFALTISTTTDASDFAIGDGEIPFKLGMRSTRAFELAVRDRYVRVEDGSVLELVRSYETVSQERTHEDVPENVIINGDGDSTGQLEGRSVRFTWDAEAGEHLVAWADEEEGDEDWLEGLAEDLDLRALLPEEEVAVGDSWELDLEALVRVLRPGGRFVWDDDGATDESEADFRIVLPGFSPEELFDALEGDALATLAEVDGDRFVVTLDLALEAEKDLVDHFTELLGEESETTRVFDEAEATLGLEGTGTLVWNGASGVFESLRFEADLESSLDTTWSNSRIDEGNAELSFYGEESGTFVLESGTGD